MRTVYKYILETPDSVMDLPSGAKFLASGCQGSTQGTEAIVVWALVDTDNENDRRRIVALNTGRAVDFEILDFLGTVQMPNGNVWHIFEAKL